MPDDLQQMASQTIWRRQVAALFNIIPTWLVGSKTFNPGNIADNAQEQTTVAVTGAVLAGSVATAGFSLDTQGIVLSAVVSAPDVVTVTFRNDTGAPIDLGSGTLTAAVFS